jgi:hypothetical protein
MLADIVSYTVDLELEAKAALLAECDVFRRTELLLQALAARGTAGPARIFPPDFSVN